MGTPFSKIGGNPIVLGLDGLKDEVKAGLNTPANIPGLAVGSSTGILGDPETASWMERTTAADGAALIESVKGNTLRWNQLYNYSTVSPTTNNGITFTVNADGSITASGTATAAAAISMYNIPVVAGHKYLFKGCPSGGSGSTYYSYLTGAGFPYGGYNDIGAGNINVPTTTGTASYVLARVNNGTTVTNLTFWPQLFDLTAMFGAGNEPSTVAEFEALFPEPYYPYDAGSLLPVRMEGVETVGFNQWDEEWESGTIRNTNGTNATDENKVRSKNHIRVIPNQTYYIKMPNAASVFMYDAGKNYIKQGPSWNTDSNYIIPEGIHFIRFTFGSSVNPVTKIEEGVVCINLSDPSRNGTYEPHWRSERAIPAATYFPEGMRSAGSVRDELTETQAITRVGAVDLGTLTWTAVEYSGVTLFQSAVIDERAAGSSNMTCVPYPVAGADRNALANVDKAMASWNSTNSKNIGIRDDSYSADAATFKTAMDGVMLYYELATPTTTPIDPPLPLSYRTGKGGTERVMVASGTTSAPPIFATRYPLDPADLAASIAPVDGPIAKTNHQVGDLLMLGFTLCKATQVIVTGETIAIGTNVTRTTVAAELAALSE